MLVLAGMLGVFLAVDLLLFYVFWELMLVPMYFLIGLWGHEDRVQAAVKFFLFTQLSGLLMLLAILALYLAHGRATGVYTFDLPALLGTPLSGPAGALADAGLPRRLRGEAAGGAAAHLAAGRAHPGAHGRQRGPGGADAEDRGVRADPLRHAAVPRGGGPLHPGDSVLAVAGILYGAFLAFAQTRPQAPGRLHQRQPPGFVLLGIFAGSLPAYQGAVLGMICHGLSTGALFVLAGSLQERLHTRDLERMGGFWATAPSLGGMMLLFALASLGLPGLGNFVAEFLVLLGAWRAYPGATVAAAAGLVGATVYALALLQRTVYGPLPRGTPAAGAEDGGLRVVDLVPRELAVTAAMGAALVWLGLFPQPVLDAATWVRAVLPMPGGAP